MHTYTFYLSKNKPEISKIIERAKRSFFSVKRVGMNFA